MTQFHVWYVTTGITFVIATNLENRQESCTDSSFKLRTTNTVIQDENEELLLPEIPGLAVISHYSKSLSHISRPKNLQPWGRAAAGHRNLERLERYNKIQLLASAVNATLLVFAAERRAAAPLLLGARRPPSYPHGAQQQTRRTPRLWSNGGCDRQTGGRTFDRFVDPARHSMQAVSKSCWVPT